MYDPRGLSEGKDLPIHIAGTWPIANELKTFSSSADITDKPAMAFCS